MKVMRALKDYVSNTKKEGGQPQKAGEDSSFEELKKIVGKEWATRDPATLFAYADIPFL